jgi:putative DNA primase/helicase
MNNSNTKLIDESKQQAPVPPDLRDCLGRNEQGDAELFAFYFSDNVAYDHSERQWYIWNGKFWEADKTHKVFQLIATEIAAQFQEYPNEVGMSDYASAKKFLERAKQLRGKRRVDNVLAIASTLSDIALTGNEWGISPMQLPVENGIIDLKTGQFREGQPHDYIRSYCPVEWVGLEAVCPIWEKTVSEIFGGDKDLIAFFQRLLGYAITGRQASNVFPFFGVKVQMAKPQSWIPW